MATSATYSASGMAPRLFGRICIASGILRTGCRSNNFLLTPSTNCWYAVSSQNICRRANVQVPANGT